MIQWFKWLFFTNLGKKICLSDMLKHICCPLTNNALCHLFYSDLTCCDWVHHCDNADISEDKAAHCYCITEGGKQVSMDKISVDSLKWNGVFDSFFLCIQRNFKETSFLFLGPSVTSCPLSSTRSLPFSFWPSASLTGPSQQCILPAAATLMNCFIQRSTETPHKVN